MWCGVAVSVVGVMAVSVLCFLAVCVVVGLCGFCVVGVSVCFLGGEYVYCMSMRVCWFLSLGNGI